MCRRELYSTNFYFRQTIINFIFLQVVDVIMQTKEGWSRELGIWTIKTVHDEIDGFTLSMHFAVSYINGANALISWLLYTGAICRMMAYAESHLLLNFKLNSVF